ncbi:MAG: hypothetical protein ACRDAM_10580, partial [Casimicrobium sp.]
TASTDETEFKRCDEVSMTSRLTKPATIGALRSVLGSTKDRATKSPEDIMRETSDLNAMEILDHTMLDQIRDIESQGEHLFVESLIGDYLNGLDAEALAVCDAIRAGNELAARKHAHALAGASLSVGAKALASELKAPRFAINMSTITAIERTVAATKAAFSEWLQTTYRKN